MKVLIIDDSPDALAVASARLVKDCQEILCASGARDGLETARREKPDLILLDVDMPDVSGFDLCRILKADAELCMIPIIFLSGVSAAEDKVHGLDLGAVDYISKPFDTFELRARVRAALRTKHLQDLLIKYAHIDPLTELANRRALMERLQQEWARIQRHGGSLAFIMVDMDNFKNVNDTYGHQVGDRVLCEVARILAGECRESDCAARYGGEEFAILVPDESAKNAAHLAERCRRKIEDIRVPAKGGDARTTASFGVSEMDGTSDSEALVRNADEALYRAKQAGRNRVVATSPVRAKGGPASG